MYTYLIDSLCGGKIFNISRVCNLISIDIHTKGNEEIHLHIQTFFRIVKKNKVVLSSEDIYRCGRNCNKNEFEWDVPGQSVFDESLLENKSVICNSTIQKVEKEKNGDLTICLNNDICLQAFIDTTKKEEKYRIFSLKEDIIVES